MTLWVRNYNFADSPQSKNLHKEAIYTLNYSLQDCLSADLCTLLHSCNFFAPVTVFTYLLKADRLLCTEVKADLECETERQLLCLLTC